MRKFLYIVTLTVIFTQAKAQRNVILIVADDLGIDYCGFYENHKDTIAMPNVRKLLAKGIRFKNAWVNPVCSPTRAGMLTGRFSFRTGVGDFITDSNSVVLDTAEITIPKVLKGLGGSSIATSQIGKWHLQFTSPKTNFIFPNTMGFDNFEGSFGAQVPNYYNWPKITNGVSKNCTTYATTENVNNAVAWIKKQQSKPFFMWLAFNAGHTPLHLPPPGMYSDSTLSGTPGNIAAYPKKYFKASIEAMDKEIGRLFDSLQVLNKLDSTDFIFVGDNGDNPPVAQGTTNAKGTIYQGGIAVPFIIAGPSVVNPGRTSNALVCGQDIFATVIDLFGFSNWKNLITINKPIDSKSIMPIIKNTSTSIQPWIFTEVFRVNPSTRDGKTIRNSHYKLLSFDNGTQKMFRIFGDPSEKTNLLDGDLTATELINYNYLCSVMSNLTGLSGSCNSNVDLPKITINTITTNVCVNAIVTFNANASKAGVAPIYQWKKNGLNVGTNNSTYIDNTLANNDAISCVITTTTSASASSNIIKMNVFSGVPSVPSWISGARYDLCNTTTDYVYEASIVSNATGYNWTVPNDAFIKSGQGTSFITVNFLPSFRLGNITVNGMNACGGGGVKVANISANPSKPSVINGINQLCNNQQNVSYSIDSLALVTGYLWAVPTDATIVAGQGTNNIVVNFGIKTGNITAQAQNNCGGSIKSVLPVNFNCRLSQSFNSSNNNSFSLVSPFDKEIIFTSDQSINHAIATLSDVTGRVVYNWGNISFNANEIMKLQMDKNIPKGIYFFKINNTSFDFVAKVSHE